MKLATQVGRYAEIATVLARHGWQGALAYLGFERLARRREVSRERAAEILPHSAVRSILSELGPTYIKIGQILSTRPDIVPEPYVKELERLQDDAAPVPLHAVRAEIEKSLGRPVEEIFDEFDPAPLASASMSQVHRAVYQGRAVAVKVQRPSIDRTIEADFVILRTLAQRLEHTWPAARRHDLTVLLDDLHDFVRAEMDFSAEGRNADRLRESLGDDESVRIPHVEWSITTRRVLVTEYLDGVKATDEVGLERIGANRSEVAERLGSTMVHQIFLNGLFHGDPHPGNVLVFADGSIGLLDFGNVPRLLPNTRQLLLNMLVGLHRDDAAAFADALLELAGGDEKVDRRQFTRDVERVLRDYKGVGPGEGRIGRVLRRAMELAMRHGLRLSGEVGVLVKACVQFEGICRRLDPRFEVLDLVSGVMLSGVFHNLSPRELAAQALGSANDLVGLAAVAPRSLTQILTKIARGQFVSTVQHRGLDEFAERLDKIANRVAYSLIVSGSIVGSSILVQAQIGPSVYGVPLFGVIAFAVSGVLGGVLLWNILTSGRLK